LIRFLLSPLVSRLERRIGRVAAVLLVAVVLFSLVGAAAGTVSRQVIDLAANLPAYQSNITGKLRSVLTVSRSARSAFWIGNRVNFLRKKKIGSNTRRVQTVPTL